MVEQLRMVCSVAVITEYIWLAWYTIWGSGIVGFCRSSDMECWAYKMACLMLFWDSYSLFWLDLFDWVWLVWILGVCFCSGFCRINVAVEEWWFYPFIAPGTGIGVCYCSGSAVLVKQWRSVGSSAFIWCCSGCRVYPDVLYSWVVKMFVLWDCSCIASLCKGGCITLNLRRLRFVCIALFLMLGWMLVVVSCLLSAWVLADFCWRDIVFFVL